MMRSFTDCSDSKLQKHKVRKEVASLQLGLANLKDKRRKEPSTMMLFLFMATIILTNIVSWTPNKLLL